MGSAGTPWRGGGSSLVQVAPMSRQRISAAGPGRFKARLRMRVPCKVLVLFELLIGPCLLKQRSIPQLAGGVDDTHLDPLAAGVAFAEVEPEAAKIQLTGGMQGVCQRFGAAALGTPQGFDQHPGAQVALQLKGCVGLGL